MVECLNGWMARWSADWMIGWLDLMVRWLDSWIGCLDCWVGCLDVWMVGFGWSDDLSGLVGR